MLERMRRCLIVAATAGLTAGAAAGSAGGCGGGRSIGDDRGVHPPVIDAGPPAPPAAAPFTWTRTSQDQVCGDRGCGPPYRLVIDFKDEAELNAVGWHRVADSKAAPAFAGGSWTAPAGGYDEWLYGPTPWNRLASRTYGWAVTATLAVRKGRAACQPNVRGPGLRLSGDLGSMSVTAMPTGLELAGAAGAIAPGARYTIRFEGHDVGISVSVNGKPAAGVAASDPGYAAPPAIELGQLGCSEYESRWDELVVEANILPCTSCRPGEHPMIAAVRQLVPDAVRDAPSTAAAYPRCLAYAAIDRAIRVVLVDALVQARQIERADELARLAPLADSLALGWAADQLGKMDAPPGFQGCDPVRSASECSGGQPPLPVPVPKVVALARRHLPSRPWADYTASGLEDTFAAAVAIHQDAGASATADLLRELVSLAAPGGTCAAASGGVIETRSLERR